MPAPLTPISPIRVTDYVKPKLVNPSDVYWWWLKTLFPYEPTVGERPVE